MTDRCSLWHGKHVLEAKVTGSNLPLIRCIRCQRVWDHYGYERIPYGYTNWGDWKKKAMKVNGIPYQTPEWRPSKYITLHADELNPVLVEYVIKFMNITDSAKIKALRAMGKETRWNIADQLFK